jgi:hypothetical protein
MDASGDPQPEAYESYFGGVSEPPLTHGWDSSLDGTALEKDDTVASAWVNIAARGDHVDRAAVHKIIVECKALAALNQKSPELLAQEMAHFADLRNAVKLLASHYADASMLRSDNESQMRRLQDHNNGVAASRAALDWMLTDIPRASACWSEPNPSDCPHGR